MEYSELCNDSYGETCGRLCEMLEYSEFLSETFIKVLEKEIATNLLNFQENSTVETKEYTQKYKELIWDNER